MLKVKTKLDRSKIAGIGVFADQEIKKGEVIWQMNNLSVFKITTEDYEKLSQEEKDFIEEKDYYWIDENGSYMIPLDDSRFINHSDNPNVVDKDDYCCIADKNIALGEEITMNYKSLVPKEHWRPYFSNETI
jgi:SET domain-containing protein